MKPTHAQSTVCVGIIAGLALGVFFGLSMGNVAYGMPIGVLLGLSSSARS